MAMIQCRECGGNISSEALTCPHCGCPQKTNEAKVYELTKEWGNDCFGARFMRILAGVIWIGGLILAIATSIETEVGRYRTTTTFLWGNFFTYLLIYAICGGVVWCVSTLFEDIHGINVALGSLRLIQKEEKPSMPPKTDRPIDVPKETAVVTLNFTNNENQIECPICGMKQNVNRTVCWNCGTKFNKE